MKVIEFQVAPFLFNDYKKCWNKATSVTLIVYTTQMGADE